MAKIIHQKTKCIGCGNCTVICPRYFEMGKDGKAHLKNSELKDGDEILEIEQVSQELKQAVNSCPVQALKLKGE